MSVVITQHPGFAKHEIAIQTRIVERCLYRGGLKSYAAAMNGRSAGDMNQGAQVQARELTCVRGGRMLFAPVSFTLTGGEALLLSGPNGAGKSSLLRMIAGLLPVGGGRLERTERVALADEKLALDDMKTLGSALRMWADLDNAPDEALADAMARLSLTALTDVPVRMLSTGQRKRAALARVFASGARLWLLDEPGNGLDAASLAQFQIAVRQHMISGGAIIAASHFDLALSPSTFLPLRPPTSTCVPDAW